MRARRVYGATGFFGLLLMFGCGSAEPQDEFERATASAIQQNCAQVAPCSIRLGALTPFQWDTLYVFEYAMTRAEIEAVLHRPLPEYREFERRFVFLRNDAIVNLQSTGVDIEGPLRNQIAFQNSSSRRYARVEAGQLFTVTRDYASERPYFVLCAVSSAAEPPKR
jgi:hypothetical protein